MVSVRIPGGAGGPAPPVQLSAPLISEKNRRQGGNLRPPHRFAIQQHFNEKNAKHSYKFLMIFYFCITIKIGYGL